MPFHTPLFALLISGALHAEYGLTTESRREANTERSDFHKPSPGPTVVYRPKHPKDIDDSEADRSRGDWPLAR